MGCEHDDGCVDGCRVSREVRRKNGVTAAIPLTRASPQEDRFNRDDTGRRNAVTVFEKFDYIANQLIFSYNIYANLSAFAQYSGKICMKD